MKFCTHYNTLLHGRTEIFQKDTTLISSDVEEQFMGINTPATDENKKGFDNMYLGSITLILIDSFYKECSPGKFLTWLPLELIS